MHFSLSVHNYSNIAIMYVLGKVYKNSETKLANRKLSKLVTCMLFMLIVISCTFVSLSHRQQSRWEYIHICDIFDLVK